MIAPNELSLTVQDHEVAFTELSFLLDILVGGIGHVVGKSSSSLAVQAGRQMGRKLPVHLVSPTLDAVMETLAETLSAGFDMTVSCDAGGASVELGRCAIRDVCAKRGQAPGGEVCRMFHCYLAGMTSELMGGRPVRASEAKVAERCSFRLECR